MCGRFCPGAGNIRGAPTLKFKECPECGAEVELFSTDIKAQCYECGFTVYNDVQSCVQWCKYAEECVGEEMYERLTGKREEEEEGEAEGK